MRVHLFKNYLKLSEALAQLVIDHLDKVIFEKGQAFFIPCTGKTPIETYANLVKYKKKIDWGKVTILQMDEYYSWPYENQSFSKFIYEKLILPLNIKHYHLIAPNYNHDIAQFYIYKEKIAQYGRVDLALHGIGSNGHIGFNEPPVDFEHPSGEGLITLADSTREANQKSFGGLSRMPKQAVALSLTELIAVEKSFIAVSGVKKHPALKTLLQLKLDKHCPATALIDNPNTEIVCDIEALWGETLS